MKVWIVSLCLAASLLTGLGASVVRAKDKPDTGESARAESALAESTRGDLSYAPAEWPDAPDTAGMLRRLVIGTAIVLGLCVGTLLIARRWLSGTPGRSSSSNALRLVETVSLGNRCSIHLVRIGEHQIVVGVDGTGVKSLVPLPASFEHAIAEVEAPTLAMVEESGAIEASAA